ncbi:hypothetical protein [Bacillus sp. FJAT-26390]|uniref:hypothetical protein n=1 Tax=Bacillus sp. FJAT-26390 TaxID=1743142 RepID=UPI000807F172|nr:hypothetical protein [Bacillus sp. FJAT-26390]OBZ13606.1 hypothetical protein A7975_12350 [Bacillus sp. FJAT-26390]
MDKTDNPIDHKPLLLGKIQYWEPFFDPEENMLKLPFHSPGYHTTLTAVEFPLVHPTYPSLLYALALLDSGLLEYAERAFDTIDKVISLQDQNAAHHTYGIWPWFYEEPLAKMSPPDWNWADFCGKQLVQIEVRHGYKLPKELRERIRQAVFCACDAIIKREVGPNYTNIALMGAFVTLIAGETYKRRDFADYGLRRLEKLHAFTNQLGTFHEFNSPTYSVIAITELSKMYTMTASAQAKAVAEDLLDGAWRMVAEHFHPATKQWSGPHSRSYSTLLTDMAKSFLQIATDGRVAFAFEKEQPYDAEWFGSGIRCPHKFLSYFTQSEDRHLHQLYSRNEQTGQQKWATTYMTPSFAIGVSSEEIMWNQTRPLLVYFDNGGEAAYLKLRVLHDGYDYCSAVLNSRVEGSQLLLGIRFLTDGGDTHPSLDRIKGSIAASDFRVRIELGGCLDHVDAEVNGERAQAIIGGCKVALRTLFAAFGAGTGACGDKRSDSWKWELTRSNGMICFDLILHDDEDRRIDFEAMGKAAVLFSLVIGEAESEVAVVSSEDAVEASFESKRNGVPNNDPIKLSIALKPAASPVS